MPTATVDKKTSATVKPVKAAKPKAAPSNTKRLSALDAAARVLSESKEPMNTRTLIERMAKKGYWTSPGGKTPQATLYSAIMREITVKGTEARFVKTDRGLFRSISRGDCS